MKKFLVLLFSIAMILGMSGTASAISFEDIDYTVVTFQGAPNAMRSYTWDFDLLSDTLAVGDIDDNDIINTATVYWSVSGDDITDRRIEEYIDISINGTLMTSNWEMDNGRFYYSNLNLADGTSGGLTVEFIMDDYFDTALFLNDPINVFNVTLAGDYTEVPGGGAPVPEPATMLLLGTGLVGLAVGSRKKIFKK